MSLGEAVEAISPPARRSVRAESCCRRWENRSALPTWRASSSERPRTAPNEIPLRFIGLRPGEKIKEDLIFQTEVRDGSAWVRWTSF